MTRAIALFALAAVCGGAGLSGCGGRSAANPSGIRGTVMIGPTCAAQRVGQHCADKPYATALRIVDRQSGEQVATTSSGEDGRFEIGLSPGRYLIAPASSNSPPSMAPVGVQVRPHRYTGVTLRFDSGIR